MNAGWKIGVCLAASLVAATVASAQLAISRHVVAGGGATFSTGGSFSLGWTIGQADAQPAPVMSGGNFVLTGGFWTDAAVCTCPGDMNGDGKKNGDDVQRFIGCLVVGGDCACADLNFVGGVTSVDVSVFVTALLTGGGCP